MGKSRIQGNSFKLAYVRKKSFQSPRGKQLFFSHKINVSGGRNELTKQKWCVDLKFICS